MAKALPRYNLLTERLYNQNSHQLFDTQFRQDLGDD